MKKKLNYYKVGALVLMIIELGIAIFTKRELLETNLTAWRLYVLIVGFIPINVMFIGAKQVRKVKICQD